MKKPQGAKRPIELFEEAIDKSTLSDHTKKRSSDVLLALIQLLVDKELITYADVLQTLRQEGNNG